MTHSVTPEEVAEVAREWVSALPGCGPHMVLAAIHIQLANEQSRGCNLTADEVFALNHFMADGDWWNDIRHGPRLAVRKYLLASSAK